MYKRQVVDKIDRGDYGYHDDVRRKIVIAKQIPTEQGDIDLEEGHSEALVYRTRLIVYQRK